MIERGHSLAVTHQCELLALSRSSVYHQPAPVSEQDLKAMRLLDEAHLQFPFYGSRRLSDWLGERGVKANRKRVRRLMRLMGLEALYPRPRTSRAGRGHKVYPYLLRELTVERPQPGVGDRYLLPPDGPRVSLPGRGHGLVQPQGARLAAVQHPQRRLLR